MSMLSLDVGQMISLGMYGASAVMGHLTDSGVQSKCSSFRLHTDSD